MDTENGTDYKNDRIEDASVPGSTNANEADLKSRTDPSDINNIAIRPTGKRGTGSTVDLPAYENYVFALQRTGGLPGGSLNAQSERLRVLALNPSLANAAPTWRGKTLRVRR